MDEEATPAVAGTFHCPNINTQRNHKRNSQESDIHSVLIGTAQHISTLRRQAPRALVAFPSLSHPHLQIHFNQFTLVASVSQLTHDPLCLFTSLLRPDFLANGFRPEWK